VTEHLPALQTALPLLAAPVCVLLRRAALVRVFAVLVTWSCLAIALSLLQEVLGHGEISYALGGWVAPLGIEYRVDILNAYVLVLVATIASVVIAFPLAGRELRIPKERFFLFYALFLLCLAGLLGITITGDLFNIFVFLEISSLSAYALIGLGRDRRALTAGFSYLVMGTIGGTFILIGIGLVYQMTGTLNIVDLSQRLPPVLGTRTVWMAFAFLVVGTSIKLAAFPLHQWLPNAYTYGPSVVASFLSATATKVAYYVLVRLLFTVFGFAFVFERVQLSALLLPLSLIAMVVGSLAAIYQTNIKRLLAYSSIAQIGYMTLGLSLANLDGLTGGLVHLFNHGLIKGGLFLVVACALSRVESPRIESLRGLGKRMPWTMAAFVVGGLGLIGIPGTVGFVSKWYLVLGALDQGLYFVAFMVLASSLLAVVYVWRVIEVMYFSDEERAPERDDAPLSMLLPTWVLIGATIYFGLDTELTAGVAEQAAAYLLGGAS
jgi:multicomponent Na+:H+ antiporter subunit D